MVTTLSANDIEQIGRMLAPAIRGAAEESAKESRRIMHQLIEDQTKELKKDTVELKQAISDHSKEDAKHFEKHSNEIAKLTNFKNRVIGMGILAGAIFSAVYELCKKLWS